MQTLIAVLRRVRRSRERLSLVETLQRDYHFDMAEPEGYDDQLIDAVAKTMTAHPAVAEVEVDHGVLSEGPYRFAVAWGRWGRMLARVDIGPDGTMRLSGEASVPS